MHKFLVVILLLSVNIFSASGCDRCIVVSDEVTLATPGCGAPGVGCSWRVVADNNKRILFVSATSSDGNLDGQILIYNDPSGNDTPQILTESGIYSLSDFALIKYVPNGSGSRIFIKVQKAAKCGPINTTFDCYRAVDAISCYCVTTVALPWEVMGKWCADHGLKLVSIETSREDQALFSTWGNYQDIWTSLSLSEKENTWVWNSTGQSLNYSNWCIGNPVQNSDRRCMKLDSGRAFCWTNDNCDKYLPGICEIQP